MKRKMTRRKNTHIIIIFQNINCRSHEMMCNDNVHGHEFVVKRLTSVRQFTSTKILENVSLN